MKTKKECRCNKPELEEKEKLAKSLIDLENSLMKMPELEQEDEMIHKAMNNINTFQCCEGELYLRGIDEYGKDFQIVFDAYDFLNWIDTENLEYIKEQLIKHIQTK